MSKPMKTNSTNPKYKRSAHKLLCLGTLCGATLSVGAVAADLQPYEKLSKQLTIMNDIFTSSLQAQSDNALKNTKISGLYLAGQGAVFTVKSSSGFDWNNRSFSFSFSDSSASTGSSVDDTSFEFFNNNENKAELMRMANEQQREKNHQFLEQQRELTFNLRDLEREKKDLAYQMRAAKKGEQESLIEQQKAIVKQKAELEKVRVILTKKSQKIKQQQKISKEKKLAARNEHYQKLTISLVETLCTYGNSLKALPKGEHVNIVLKSAGNRVGRSYQDKILVLTKRNINACVMDEVSAEKLLSSTKKYQF